jgi:hypothetical protein
MQKSAAASLRSKALLTGTTLHGRAKQGRDLDVHVDLSPRR